MNPALAKHPPLPATSHFVLFPHTFFQQCGTEVVQFAAAPLFSLIQLHLGSDIIVLLITIGNMLFKQ